MSLCNRCNRPLKTQKSIHEGYGPVCKKKQKEADEAFDKIQVTIDDVLDKAESE